MEDIPPPLPPPRPLGTITDAAFRSCTTTLSTAMQTNADGNGASNSAVRKQQSESLQLDDGEDAAHQSQDRRQLKSSAVSRCLRQYPKVKLIILAITIAAVGAAVSILILGLLRFGHRSAAPIVTQSATAPIISDTDTTTVASLVDSVTGVFASMSNTTSDDDALDANDGVGVNVIEVEKDGVPQKYKSRSTTFDNIFGVEWNKTRYQTLPINFKTDSGKNNVEFQCQFYPNYDDAFRVAIKLTNSSSEKLAVWLSISLSVVVEKASIPLAIIVDEPSLFSNNGSLKCYQKSVQSFYNVTEAGMRYNRSSQVTVFIEITCFERDLTHRSSITSVHQPHSPMHDISYTWAVYSYNRAFSLALKESGVSQLKSSVFPSGRAGQILFYATMSRQISDEKNTSPDPQVTTELCYALLCKPRAASNKGILIDVSISTVLDELLFHWESFTLLPVETAQASNFGSGCLSNISVQSDEYELFRQKLSEQRVFKIKYNSRQFSRHCSSNQTIL